jgi:hypothetical protein
LDGGVTFMNTLQIPCRSGEVSDGYHTFDELYEHRHALFMALLATRPGLSWMSHLHEDGTSMEGWFIAGVNLPQGPITYHLPIRLWNECAATGCLFRVNAPKWDGHTSTEVIQRLKRFAQKGLPE